MIQTLHRHLQGKNTYVDSFGTGVHTYSEISRTCSELLTRKHLKHAFHRSHGGKCRQNILTVNFQNCSSLVRRREVELKSGKCLVHCGVWGKLLICFFCDLLALGVEELARTGILEIVKGDIRLKSIVSQTLEIFHEQSCLPSRNLRESNTIKAIMVDKESEFFPPCAFNILKNLRHDHRVGHHARIQLSLFLKGIGLDVGEAIKFWKEEYSKSPNCGEHGSRSCQHAWKKDNSRYIYNIKHLYGLKGSCKNYQSKSCLSLQSTGGNTGEGCPFVRMHPKDIVKFLPQVIVKNYSNVEGLIKQVVELTSRGKPSDACKACFNAHYVTFKIRTSGEEFVDEDVHPNRGNAFLLGDERKVSEYNNEFKNMCPKNALKGTGIDEVRVKKLPVTGVNLNGEVSFSGRFVEGLARGNDNSSQYSSPDFTDDNEFNCPTQYYFSLKSRLLSQFEINSCK